MDDDERRLVSAIAELLSHIKPKARVLVLAELFESQIKQFGCKVSDETEVAAALKSLLVVRAGKFTEAQKAVTESLMSRDLLHLGIKGAREKAVSDG